MKPVKESLKDTCLHFNSPDQRRYFISYGNLDTMTLYHTQFSNTGSRHLMNLLHLEANIYHEIC